MWVEHTAHCKNLSSRSQLERLKRVDQNPKIHFLKFSQSKCISLPGPSMRGWSWEGGTFCWPFSWPSKWSKGRWSGYRWRMPTRSKDRQAKSIIWKTKQKMSFDEFWNILSFFSFCKSKKQKKKPNRYWFGHSHVIT